MKSMRYALPCLTLLLVGCGGDLFGGGASLGGSGKPSDSINTGVPNRPQLIADNRTAENSTITYSAPITYDCMGIRQQLQFVDESAQPISNAVSLPFSSSIGVIVLIENRTDDMFEQQFEQCRTPFQLLDAQAQRLPADQIYQCDLGTIATLTLQPRELQQHRYHIKTPKAGGSYFIEYSSRILPTLSEPTKSTDPKKLDAIDCQQQLRLTFTVANAQLAAE